MEHKVEVMLVVVTNIGVTNHHLNILLQTWLFLKDIKIKLCKGTDGH